jgi:hypothetical protein
MAERIRIDQGIKEYEIENERGEVIGSFSLFPSDVGIVDRYEAVVNFFSSYDLSLVEDIENTEARNNFVNQLKHQFDVLFDTDGISESVFAKMHPLSLMANGGCYYECVLESIAAVIEKEINARVKKKLSRVRKATAKYRK